MSELKAQKADIQGAEAKRAEVVVEKNRIISDAVRLRDEASKAGIVSDVAQIFSPLRPAVKREMAPAPTAKHTLKSADAVAKG